MISKLSSTATLNTNLLYLAKTIYGEARGENVETMLVVGWVSSVVGTRMTLITRR